MHTIMGSAVSNLTVENAAKKISKKNLDGACLTEHSSIWEKNSDQIEDIFNLYNLKVFRAIEISTDYGHIIAIGFDKYYSGSHKYWINSYKEFSKYSIHILGLPGRKWK